MTIGAQLIAQTLKQLDIDVAFGIVGIPVVEVADAMIAHGIKFISFRNEQAASYAASAYGYLTGKPGVLLVVGGPGVVHAAAGILNATSNGWPLLVLAGSSSVDEVYKGGFQELDQVSYLEPHTKFAGRPFELAHVPFLIEKAYRTSYFGKPGPTYVDLPANIIQQELSSDELPKLLQNIHPITYVPKNIAEQSQITKISKLLADASNPLVIIGKGASYTNASPQLIKLIEDHKLPFLPTPMGKGVIPDDNPLNLNSARSGALQNADVVLLVGARLNWILHHGEAPRFQKNVKFIQVDVSSEEIGNNSNKSIEYGLVGHIPSIITQINNELLKSRYTAPSIPQSIIFKRESNQLKQSKLENLTGPILKYHRVYKILKDKLSHIQDKITYVSEGANTMDVARVSFSMNKPKQRLDAGTNATMGLGLGYAIAAKLAQPQNIVIAIEGDSAFGFSGMELETCFRSHLPIIVVVMNNSGVYHGVDQKEYGNTNSKILPSTALSFDTRYDLMAKSLGINGVLVKTEDDLKDSVEFALGNYKKGESTLINVIIDSGAGTKLEFGWQNKKAKM